MDNESIGGLIRALRTEKGLTQRELADMIGVSSKAVSKWETFGGAPDVSLLTALSEALGVDVGGLLSGRLTKNDEVSANMKRTRFYVCPDCGGLLSSTSGARLSCCGRPLDPLEAKTPDEAHELSVETVEGEWFISSGHPMTREHHISFAALLTTDRADILRLYPEWEMQTRFSKRGHGTLYWYCTEHGLFKKSI